MMKPSLKSRFVMWVCILILMSLLGNMTATITFLQWVFLLFAFFGVLILVSLVFLCKFLPLLNEDELPA